MRARPTEAVGLSVKEMMRLKEREGIEPIKGAQLQMKKEVDDLAIKYEVVA